MTRQAQRVKVKHNMKQVPHMPSLIRLWLFLSKHLAPIIHVIAKRSLRRLGANPARAMERLGQASVARPEGRLLWVHAASLGEISQTRALIEKLCQDVSLNILVTTVSQSGADWVARELPQVIHQFLPLDTPTAVAGFLDHWQPQGAAFVEGDIWPRLLIAASQKEIPLLLLNARPSKSRDRSPQAFGYLLTHFTAITCKSAQVYDGLAKIGISDARLYQFGDLRASAAPLPHDAATVVQLSAQIAGRPIWIAASSHASDEAEIITACRDALRQRPQTLLIWAPRHPDRAKDIIAATQDFVVRQRSQSEDLTPDTQIYLADTLGELGTMFSLTDVVFLGGAFGKQGGHNPYEPACFGCVMITGPHMRNHKDGFAALADVGAATVVQNGAALGQEVMRLLASPDTTRNGKSAQAFVQKANGATDKTVALILEQI